VRAIAKGEGVPPKDFSNAVCKPSKVAAWREQFEARAAAEEARAAAEAQAAAASEGEEEEEGPPAKRARPALA